VSTSPSDSNAAAQEYFRYLRDHAGPQLKLLDQQIKDAKERLDNNRREIEAAKKRKTSCKLINKLYRKRKAITKELCSARKNRKKIKMLINAAKHYRNETGRIYIARQKH